MEIVAALRAALAERVGTQRFEFWFGEGTHLVVTADTLVVIAPNLFFQDWLRRNFRDPLAQACQQVLGRPLSLEFRVSEESAPAAKKDRPSPADVGVQSPTAALPQVELPPTIPFRSAAKPPLARGRRFARLDQFAVGDSNRLAHATAQLVASNLGRWTPLVIHGPSGVGKTHLLEGIWLETRRTAPQRSAVLLSAEQFTTYFLEALRGSGLPNFRRKYRGVELLIIDDVQFFIGKRATLGELFYTINSLLEEGRQIVLSADRPPAELGELGRELASRLCGGVNCGVDPPELDVRMAIVRHLSRQLELDLPDDVVAFVASHLTEHTRELAGAVNRLHAAHLATDRPISLSMAEESLADLIGGSRRHVQLPQIERAICEVFGLQQESLQSDRRTRDVSYPRMLAMWLARKHTRSALTEIGQYFGGRTHSTVVSAQKKVEAWVQAQERVRIAGGSLSVDEVIRRAERSLLVG